MTCKCVLLHLQVQHLGSTAEPGVQHKRSRIVNSGLVGRDVQALTRCAAAAAAAQKHRSKHL